MPIPEIALPQVLEAAPHRGKRRPALELLEERQHVAAFPHHERNHVKVVRHNRVRDDLAVMMPSAVIKQDLQRPREPAFDKDRPTPVRGAREEDGLQDLPVLWARKTVRSPPFREDLARRPFGHRDPPILS
jgi:hypothetical protein